MSNVETLTPPPVPQNKLLQMLDLEWLSAQGEDRRFDEFLNLNDGARDRLVSAIAPTLDSDRQRRRKASEQGRFELTFCCVIANAIVAMGRQRLTRTYYSRNDWTYVGSTPYKPEWLFSAQLIKTVDACQKAGLLKLTTAPSLKVARGQRSTFRATEHLKQILFDARINKGDVVSNGQRPAIILRDENKRQIGYDPADVASEAEFLDSYNQYLAGFRIEVAEAYSGQPLPTWKTSLYRVFNGDFEHGGRFYGGWWIDAPKAAREHLTIDGEATCELDFSGFQPRALYHERGQVYIRDPYQVPELMSAYDHANKSWADGRQMTKKLFCVMINAKGRQGIHGCEEAEGLPNLIKPKEAFDAIERYHRPIKDAFFSGYSLRLAKKESDISESILKLALESEIPILPIHDSYVCKQTHRNWVRDRMRNEYHNVFGFYPLIT